MTSTAFLLCEACGGRGFVRTGDFAERKFPRCGRCNGLGQTYLDPAPAPAINETPAMPF